MRPEEKAEIDARPSRRPVSASRATAWPNADREGRLRRTRDLGKGAKMADEVNKANSAAMCLVCESPRIQTLEPAFDAPILMNRLYPSAEEARAAPVGQVLLARCADCGFTWNRAFRPDLVAYDEDYENDQTLSGVFKDHVKQRAKAVVAAADRLRYLEIGCGQGAFMALVAERAGARLEFAEGFDPAWRGADGYGPSGARIHKSYFAAESAAQMTGTPNVAALRMTISHVVEPVTFLRTIRAALGEAAEATIFVETQSLDWIVRNNAIQDWSYEGYSNFTSRALAIALSRAGFENPMIEDVFGGQYLWAHACTRPHGPLAPTPEPVAIADVERRRNAFISHWRAEVSRATRRGRCAIWGAGAKGANFALMVGLDGQTFDHAVDINPGKQGRRLPGSAVAVLSPAQSVARSVDTYFVMNPMYLDEIARTLESLGERPRLVPLA
jgi:hypothetical protein